MIEIVHSAVIPERHEEVRILMDDFGAMHTVVLSIHAAATPDAALQLEIAEMEKRESAFEQHCRKQKYDIDALKARGQTTRIKKKLEYQKRA